MTSEGLLITGAIFLGIFAVLAWVTGAVLLIAVGGVGAIAGILMLTALFAGLFLFSAYLFSQA